MPLDKSGSAESVGKNIKAEKKAGKSTAQATAIALNTERENAKGARKAKLEDAYAKYIEKKAWSTWAASTPKKMQCCVSIKKLR